MSHDDINTDSDVNVCKIGLRPKVTGFLRFFSSTQLPSHGRSHATRGHTRACALRKSGQSHDHNVDANYCMCDSLF